MKLTAAVALVGLAVVAGAASAQQSTGPVNDVVAARKAAFSMSAVTVNAIKSGIDANAPLQSQGFAVSALKKWSHALPGMFPSGTSVADLPGATAAKPEIWTDRAGFEAKAADYAAAVDHLSELAQANDVASFNAQFAVVRSACGSCHSVYRIEQPRPAGPPPGAVPAGAAPRS
jgi:cytochrome c556